MTVFEDSFSEEIWKVTYKHFNDATVDDTLRRVATAAASVEETEEKKAEWGQKFYEMLSDFKVTVGGRIYANAGTGWGGTTLMNCVSGDTMIHTRDGVVPARTLEGREVDTLSQDGIFRKASWYCYGEQELYRVAFSNGDEVFATANHEWVTPNARGGFYRVKTTDMLGKTVPIQHISSFSYDETEYLEGVRHGLTFGDGWKYMDGKYSMLRQFTDSQPLIAEFFSGYHTHSAQLTNGLNYTQVTKLPAEYKSLPSTDASRSYLRGFIAGLIGADGHVDARGHAMIHISNEATANAVRILCTHAGIGVTSITKVRTENPFNGEPSSLFKLAITKASLYGDKFMLIKASHRENMAASKKPRNRAVVKVVSVSPTGRTEPVYCCVEPETHTMVVGNGYLTGQCFVGPITEGDFDSLDGIYKALLDQARTLKSEGGWGFNFSFIRPRGSFIHGIGVESPGAVRFMELFDKSSEIITSGSGEAIKNKKAKGKIRKGAMMGVLNAWHPDVIEFITAKQTPGRLTKFNLSVNCTDDFMDKVIRVMDMKAAGAAQELIDAADQWDLVFPDTTHEAYRKEWAGDLKNWKNKGYPVVTHRTVSATWLWNLIMESTYNRAEPGVLFLDRANKLNPLSYKETIYATNPSMPAGTKVHTRDGIFDIETLQDKTFMVKSLDGQWAEAKCFKSGVNKELVQFNFDHTGFKFVRSTKEHRWPVYDKRMGRIYKVYASEVKPGDLIPLNRNETIGIEGDASLTRDEGFMLGYLVGDGWFGKRDNGDYYAGFVFGPSEAEYKNAQRICEIINGMKSEKSTVCQTKNGYEVRTTSTEFCNLLMTRFGLIPGEKTFPEVVWSSNDSFIEGFVDGLLSSDGCVNVKQRVIHFTSSRKDIAVSFAKLLSFAGINASIYTSTKKSKFPNGKDYGKEYTRYDVKINGSMCGRFYNVFNITHETKAAKLNALVSSTKIRESIFNDYIEVKSVQYGGMEDVWDISVYHDQHVFPAEWSYTGNCGEQMLAPGGVCNLASLNLTQFVKPDLSGFDLPKVRTFVGYMVRFLDNVSSLSLAPLPEYEQSMRTKRRIGCGVLGWGSALFMLKTRFGSAEAHAIREELMRTIAHAAYEASIDLAEEKGMFAECVPELHAEGEFIKQIGLPDHLIERMKKVGIRNSALLSCQPTGNTSIFANVVSGGIEPVFMPEYIRTVIQSVVPDHLKDVTPKFHEGEMVETSFFKWAKEGDEDILRGTDEFGTVWKIDRNRGLTKEVLCEDQGVRVLKARGEWDATASYAATATVLSVQEHIDDLKGFAKYIDSAISKTINIPYDYPFEDFKKVYIDGYKTGYIKGLTTYRMGTMTTVLSAKEEKNADASDEEIILEDVKLPDSAPAVVKKIKAEGKKWYLTVVLDEEQKRPFALFVQTNNQEKNVTTSDAMDQLFALAERKGIPERHIEDVKAKCGNDNNASKIARVISLLLRHGVLIKNIVLTLDKVENVTVGSFLFQIKKFLETYIKDGEKVEGEKCQSCGSHNIVYSEGCKKCHDCGSSKCS